MLISKACSASKQAKQLIRLLTGYSSILKLVEFGLLPVQLSKKMKQDYTTLQADLKLTETRGDLLDTGPDTPSRKGGGFHHGGFHPPLMRGLVSGL